MPPMKAFHLDFTAPMNGGGGGGFGVSAGVGPLSTMMLPGMLPANQMLIGGNPMQSSAAINYAGM